MNVDLRELAIDRGDPPVPGSGVSRPALVLPLVLIGGFVGLLIWASWDFLLPPKSVRVVPVVATTTEFQVAGTPVFQAAGWIEPRPTPVRAAALAPGVIEELLVVEDQLVSAGDPLAELVKDDATLRYERALADVELRQAEFDEARAGETAAITRFEQPVHLQAALGQADAALAQIETALQNLPFAIRRAVADHAALQLDYEGKASAAGVVAGVTIDLAKGKAVAAEALVDELRDRSKSLAKEQGALIQRRDALQTQLELLAAETEEKDKSAANVRAMAARVSQARVTVAEAKLQLDRMTVRAPIDGRVFRLIAHPGARIGGGMTQMEGHDGSTVVTLYRPDSLQVRVDVRFEDIPKVSLNQVTEINNPALSSPLTGRVLFISSEADIQKNTLQVKVAIPNPPAVFKPEMLVDVTFLAPPSNNGEIESEEELVLAVPQQLVHQEDGTTFVWLADQSEGTARKTVVQTGASRPNGLVQITSGLNVSSRIISEGSGNLTEGDRIKVVGEDLALGQN